MLHVPLYLMLHVTYTSALRAWLELCWNLAVVRPKPRSNIAGLGPFVSYRTTAQYNGARETRFVLSAQAMWCGC